MLSSIFKVGRLVSGTFFADFWRLAGSLSCKVIPNFLPQRYKVVFFNLIYYYHFSIFDFLGAYKARATALRILLDVKTDEAVVNKNASAIEWQLRCYHYYLGEQSEIPKLDSLTEPCNDKNDNKALVVGPRYKRDQNSDIDLYIFLKPYDPIAKQKKRALLLQNDSYYLKNEASVKDWVKKTNSELILTKKINLPFFELNASLMGLQRAVFYLINSKTSNQIFLNGFDLNTGQEQYDQDYPSLLPKDRKELNAKLHISLARHDYLMNLIFMKSVINDPRVVTCGDVVSIVQKNSISELLFKMHKALCKRL